MKNKIKNVLAVICFLIALIASAGALNYGHATQEHLYSFCGVANILFTIVNAGKYFKNNIINK